VGAAVLGVTVVLGLLSFSGVAGAAAHKGTPPKVAKHVIPPSHPPYLQFNSGTADSSQRLFGKNGQLLSYGNKWVTYYLPQMLVTGDWCKAKSAKSCTPDLLISLGHQLYQQNCEACHGVHANGVSSQINGYVAYPSLLGLGPATYDFWIESGRMPAASTPLTQPMRRPARLDHLQALALSAYLTNLPGSSATPYIPKVANLAGANLSDGAALFAMNCAACHTITGDGDALAYSTFAPSLRDIPATQVAEALRTGPANMPVFSGNLTDGQLRDVVAYVTEKIQHPQNPGGLGLGGIGPVAEGFVGLALGVGLLALVGFWIGDRS
jgi:ubiquinol-cytochrome c reductase cytochrome c subunit